jgi:phytoene dehydrogenase-like protein
LPPSQIHAFTGSRIYNEFLIDGGYYPEGGIQNLPNALDQIIKQNLGKTLYRRTVRKIICKNNVAVGIKLDNDELYISKYVVSACDVTQTFRTFLRRDIVSNQIIDKLKRMTPSISTFILYVGIDKPFKELPQPGTNIWYLPYYDLDKVFNYVLSCDFDNIGAFMMRVSPDTKTLLAFSLAPFRTKVFWRQNKKRIAQDFLDRVEKFIPNLKKHIVYFDAATPYTLYRYTLNYKGANYGWAPLQSQLFDPDFRQKSFIKGLYLTGHWTAQTHGIPGVAYLGYNAAKLILKREKII